MAIGFVQKSSQSRIEDCGSVKRYMCTVRGQWICKSIVKLRQLAAQHRKLDII